MMYEYVELVHSVRAVSIVVLVGDGGSRSLSLLYVIAVVPTLR